MENQSKRIFITGGTGLLGVPLMKELIDSNFLVHALVRSGKSKNKFRKILRYYTSQIDYYFNKINWIEGNLSDTLLLENILQEMDFVIHAAALVSFDPRDADMMRTTNINGTQNLINIALHCNIKRFIHISSIATINRNLNQENDFQENLWPTNYASTYAYTKIVSELEVWRGFEEGLSGVILNPGVILGPGEWKRGSSQIFNTVRKGLRFYTLGSTGYIDVRDVVESILNFLTNKITNERYILCSENLNNKELLHKIADAFKVKKARVLVSKRILIVFYFLIQPFQLIFQKSFLTKEIIASATSKSYYSSRKYLNLGLTKFREINETIHFVVSKIAKQAD